MKRGSGARVQCRRRWGFSAVKKNTGADAGCCGEIPAGRRASLHFMVRLCLVFRSSPMKNDLIDAMMRDGADFVFGPASFLSTGERNEVLEPEGLSKCERRENEIQETTGRDKFLTPPHSLPGLSGRGSYARTSLMLS